MEDLDTARILIVDDQASNVLLLEQLLARDGYTNVSSLTESSQTLPRFESDPPDLLLLDLQMPTPDGFEVMELISPWTSGETHVPVLVLTADASRDTKLRALAAGARDFLSKPFDALEASLRIRNLLRTRKLELDMLALNESLEGRVRERTRELEHARVEAFQRLAMAAEYRDDETRRHTERVGLGAGLLAAELGLDSGFAEVIEKVAPLHDLGKIGIPDAVLLKPGRLDEEELEIMRGHAVIGAEILTGSNSPLFEAAAEIALTHHERWDGSGYPRGLAGEQIPIGGRIVGLIDAFDAMTHERPYKAAMPLDEAVAEVRRCAGAHFDPSLVAAFCRLDAELLADPPLSAASAKLSDAAWRTLYETAGSEPQTDHFASDAALAATFADTPVATLIADDERRYVAANAAALELLGLDVDQLRSMRIDDLAVPELRTGLDAVWAEFLASGLLSCAFELLLSDSRRLTVNYRGVAHLLPGRHLSMLTPVQALAATRT